MQNLNHDKSPKSMGLDPKLSTPIELEGLPDLSKARKIFEAYEGLKDDGAIRVTKREANIIADKTKNVFPREN